MDNKTKNLTKDQEKKSFLRKVYDRIDEYMKTKENCVSCKCTKKSESSKSNENDGDIK